MARPSRTSVDLFLQIGNGTTVFYGNEVQIHQVDGHEHLYQVELTQTMQSRINQNKIALTVTVDGMLRASITTQTDNHLPLTYGIVAKSMRVSPDNVNVDAQLTLRDLQLEQTASIQTPTFGSAPGMLLAIISLGLIVIRLRRAIPVPKKL